MQLRFEFLPSKCQAIQDLSLPGLHRKTLVSKKLSNDTWMERQIDGQMARVNVNYKENKDIYQSDIK